jgi:hypothetical protein
MCVFNFNLFVQDASMLILNNEDLLQLFKNGLPDYPTK